MELEQMPLMEREHEAWLRFVHECKELDLDINEDKYSPLVRSIERWGEELVALRESQEAELRERVRLLKRAQARATATSGFVPYGEREEGWGTLPPLQD